MQKRRMTTIGLNLSGQGQGPLRFSTRFILSIWFLVPKNGNRCEGTQVLSESRKLLNRLSSPRCRLRYPTNFKQVWSAFRKLLCYIALFIGLLWSGHSWSNEGPNIWFRTASRNWACGAEPDRSPRSLVMYKRESILQKCAVGFGGWPLASQIRLSFGRCT